MKSSDLTEGGNKVLEKADSLDVQLRRKALDTCDVTAWVRLAAVQARTYSELKVLLSVLSRLPFLLQPLRHCC